MGYVRNPKKRLSSLTPSLQAHAMTPEQNKAYISAANEVRAAKGQPPLTPAQETQVLAKLAAKQAAKGPKTTDLGTPTWAARPLGFLGWPFTEIGLGTIAIVAGGAVGTYYLYHATKRPKSNPAPLPGQRRYAVLDLEGKFVGVYWAKSEVDAIRQAIADGHDAWSVRPESIGH